ncbi:MAG: hypothetical protein QM617_01830 [Comamonas sp.]
MATKARSPNYPQISLARAIDLTAKLYDKAHTHKASSAVVASSLGYNGLNGASLGVISALKKYGLIEGVGDNEFKISKDGLSIIVDPKSSTDRATAIIRAAFRPALFAELRTEYGDKPPKSDDFLRAFLLKRGFVQSVVDTPIRTYRETMDLVESAQAVLGEASQGLEPRAGYEEEEEAAPIAALREGPAQAPAAPLATPVQQPISADMVNDVYKLPDGRAFVLSWPAKITADEYEDFEAWISLLQRKLKRQIEQ